MTEDIMMTTLLMEIVTMDVKGIALVVVIMTVLVTESEIVDVITDVIMNVIVVMTVVMTVVMIVIVVMTVHVMMVVIVITDVIVIMTVAMTVHVRVVITRSMNIPPNGKCGKHVDMSILALPMIITENANMTSTRNVRSIDIAVSQREIITKIARTIRMAAVIIMIPIPIHLAIVERVAMMIATQI